MPSSTSSSSAIVLAVGGAVAAVTAVGVFLATRRAKHSVTLSLPSWAMDEALYTKEYKTDEERMALAIEMAARNVTEGTGGPFGCCIFERDVETGECKLFSVGVNRVVPLNNSTLHGEMVAIQIAQKKLKTFSLQNGTEGKEYDLFTSCEPCCMCLGGTLWSGVSRLVCAASKADAMAIGFDEGPVFEESYVHLQKAGIEVTRGVLQDKGAEVLKKYGETGHIYNR